MTSEEARLFLNKIRSRYLIIRYLESLLWTVSVFLLSMVLFNIFSVNSPTSFTISAIIGLFFIVVKAKSLDLFNFKLTLVTSYLSQQHNDLEESADLFLVDDSQLSLIQQIQKDRSLSKLASIKSSIRFPHRLGIAAVIFMIGLLTYAADQYFDFKIQSSTTDSPTDPALAEMSGSIPKKTISVSKASTTITAPAYTSIRTETKTDLNLNIPENSIVTWNIQFDGIPVLARIIFSNQDTLKLAQGKTGNYTGRMKLFEKGFYQVQWDDGQQGNRSTDFYKIEVIKDLAPKIIIEDLQQFTELSYQDGLTISFNTTLSDDYGLQEANIIATVSKGSGESVKFREEKLRFDTPEQIRGKRVKARRTINFKKMGMEPGDELYFYVEASDNKQPFFNGARTETWFIALKDTTTETVTEDSGMGVDLMPEYFRSQRQIIIDTEKLIDEEVKKKVTRGDFNFRSNELGYDQKVLRLRYGQFLGEEFESSVTPIANAEDESVAETEEDIKEKYGHTHDKGNEHNLVKDKPIVKEEEHHDEKEQADGEEGKNPLEAFAHQHDKGDEATYFVQSIKVKLKAALTLMWDAELQLRLYEPAKSLPYQYQILKLLKEISNDSRVYVHRTGIAAPPLKEEKRLTGDMAELNNSSLIYSTAQQEKYPAIRQSLQIIEQLIEEDSIKINQDQRRVLQIAGNELAGIAIEKPGIFLESLSELKAVINDEIQTGELRYALLKIRAAFWTALPNDVPTPSRNRRSTHSLNDAFIKNLN